MKKIRLNSNIRCIEIVYGDSYYEGPARWIVTLDVLKSPSTCIPITMCYSWIVTLDVLKLR